MLSNCGADRRNAMSLKYPVAAIFSLILMAGCVTESSQPKVVQPSVPPPQIGSNQVLIALGPSSVQRMGQTRIKMNPNGWPTITPPKPEDLMKGEITVGTEK